MGTQRGRGRAMERPGERERRWANARDRVRRPIVLPALMTMLACWLLLSCSRGPTYRSSSYPSNVARRSPSQSATRERAAKHDGPAVNGEAARSPVDAPSNNSTPNRRAARRVRLSRVFGSHSLASDIQLASAGGFVLRARRSTAARSYEDRDEQPATKNSAPAAVPAVSEQPAIDARFAVDAVDHGPRGDDGPRTDQTSDDARKDDGRNDSPNNARRDGNASRNDDTPSNDNTDTSRTRTASSQNSATHNDQSPATATAAVHIGKRTIRTGHILVAVNPTSGPAELREYSNRGALLNAIELPAGERPRDLAVGRDGRVHLFPAEAPIRLASWNASTGRLTFASIGELEPPADVRLGAVAAVDQYVFLATQQPRPGVLRFDVRTRRAEYFHLGRIVPVDLAPGLDGRLYVLADDRRTVRAFHPRTMLPFRTLRVEPPLRGIAADEKGYVFATADDGHFYVFNHRGGTLVKSTQPINGAHDLEMDAAGRIVMAIGDDTIGVMHNHSLPNGTPLTFRVPAGDSLFVALIAPPPTAPPSGEPTAVGAPADEPWTAPADELAAATAPNPATTDDTLAASALDAISDKVGDIPLFMLILIGVGLALLVGVPLYFLLRLLTKRAPPLRERPLPQMGGPGSHESLSLEARA